MTNHQTLNSYIINNTKLSNRQFQYKDVLKIANEVLVSSLPGKSYATLKFLQVYCTPVIEEISEASSFRHGDPRNFEEIDAVKKNWFFRMSNNNELTQQSMPKDFMDKISLDNTNRSNTVKPNGYSALIKFLTNELSKYDEKEYEWSYSIRDNVDWINNSLLKGNSLTNAQKVLTIAGAILKYSIDNADEQLCFESVRLIMDWGGVYYPRGQRKGNKDKVTEYYKNNTLLERISMEYQLFLNERTDNIILMNAGWTKVWSVLFPDRFIMFDSRVSFAIAQLFANFCNYEKAETGYYQLPLEIGFKQIKQGRRSVDGFQNVNSKPKDWANSMIISSKILRECLSYAQIEETNISRYNSNDLRSIEARLFMMGA
jgi:hypothetical protein